MISSIYLIYQILAVSRTSQAISSAPIEPLLSAAGGNRTTLKTQISPAWVSIPGMRGTSDILWSCIVTLAACVYTAIHLNVPPPQEGRWRFLWRKSKWVALALFAPEIVLYSALTQLLEAWKFKNKMNELWATRKASPDPAEQKEPKLAPPDAPDSHSDGNSNVAEQNNLAQATQQNQAPSEISPVPLPNAPAPESEDTTKDENTHPISGDNTGHGTSSQPPQRPLSISSRRNADGQSGPKGFDLEKGMITPPSKRFSLKYGFFVVMGGIATQDVAKISNDVKGSIVLTPDAVIHFARRGVFFDISPEAISDKSKANLLGKGLVCMQVIWFVIQCIARRAAGYPLALLEVPTMVHVLCALSMYAFWWEKPQDVSEPAVQDLSRDMDLLAVLLSMSSMSGMPNLTREASRLVWYGKTALQDPLLNRACNGRRLSSLEPSDPRYEVKVLRNEPQSQFLQPFDRSEGQVVALIPGQALNCGIGPYTLPHLELDEEQRITYLSAKDVLRWTKLSEWLHKYNQRHLRNKVSIAKTEDFDYNQHYSRSLYVQLNSPSGIIVPRDALSQYVSELPEYPFVLFYNGWWMVAMSLAVASNLLLILLVILPLIYGGIHLTTWNFHFASQTEQLLWRIACIDIMGTMPLAAIFFTCVDLDMDFSYSWPRVLVETIHWIFFTSLILFYTLSRVYIVVESFISLRHVPIGVYAAIPWIQDIPHI